VWWWCICCGGFFFGVFFFFFCAFFLCCFWCGFFSLSQTRLQWHETPFSPATHGTVLPFARRPVRIFSRIAHAIALADFHKCSAVRDMLPLFLIFRRTDRTLFPSCFTCCCRRMPHDYAAMAGRPSLGCESFPIFLPPIFLFFSLDLASAIL